MAEAGRPVSDLYPLGGAVSLESTLPGQSLFNTSKRSTQAKTPSRLAGGPGYPCHEESKEALSELCKGPSATPPAREMNCSSLRAGGESGEQSPSEHCVPPRALSRQHSLAETRTTSHHHEIVVNAINDNPRASRTVQSIKPASVPVHRSHSDTLPLIKQGVSPLAPDSDNGLAYHPDQKGIQEVDCHSMLAYKQPMQLQQCNIITTVCREANSRNSGVQQSQSRCVCISSPKAAAKVEEKGSLPLKCDMALCYGSYIHHANFEDTFAAYCHPQPIPATSQLLPRLAGIEPSCDLQHAVEPPSVTNHLTLPRLISSVSDTGLDTKHLLRCCNLNYSWISSLPPGAGPQFQKHFGGEECCCNPVGHVRTMTRDMGTMTAHTELRDVWVQTVQTITPHVFPHICLTEESRSEMSCSQSLNTDGSRGRKQSSAPKSPVKEVKWDAEGMTWEVYGASVDPEELGLAIQRHLELQIKETAIHAAKLSHQNTNTSRQSGNTSCWRKRSKMMGSIRTSVCCALNTTAVD